MKCLMPALVLGICLISGTNLFASGAVSQALPNPLRKPGGCYQEDTGHLKQQEEITLPGKCIKASCSSDGTTTYFSCGAIMVTGPGCRVSEVDLSKPYPDCCPKPICDAGSV